MQRHQKVDHIIKLKDVLWEREGRLILDKVSWEVLSGQHWAIIGLNGSGKTSILNMVTGYQWPNSGEIDVLGHRLGEVDLRELRKSIGWVSVSFSDRYHTHARATVVEVVLSGKFASVGVYEEVTKQDEEMAWDLLHKFHCSHLAEKPYRVLSQGEKQKVMLARAWMAQPDLIILDEPCNGLDIRTREELLDTINHIADIAGGPTILYVTHHIEEIVSSISHVLLISEGRVVAAGEKQEVLTEPLLEQAFQLPIAVRWENHRAWMSVKAISSREGSS